MGKRHTEEAYLLACDNLVNYITPLISGCWWSDGAFLPLIFIAVLLCGQQSPYEHFFQAHKLKNRDIEHKRKVCLKTFMFSFPVLVGWFHLCLTERTSAVISTPLNACFLPPFHDHEKISCIFKGQQKI